MPPLTPWPTPPARLALEPGWGHVFCFRLDRSADRLASLRALLSPDELARADRFLRAADGAHFTAARGQLRQILSAYTGLPAAGLSFRYNPQGKPALAYGGAEGDLRFNLSHISGLGLLAVTEGREVGVDIEWLGREVDFRQLASRFFAPAEVAALAALPPHELAQGFYNGWTRKEAYIKARGLGLAIPLDSFEVSLTPGEPPRLKGAQGAWSLHALEPAPGYTAAVVVEGEIEGLRCWRW